MPVPGKLSHFILLPLLFSPNIFPAEAALCGALSPPNDHVIRSYFYAPLQIKGTDAGRWGGSPKFAQQVGGMAGFQTQVSLTFLLSTSFWPFCYTAMPHPHPPCFRSYPSQHLKALKSLQQSTWFGVICSVSPVHMPTSQVAFRGRYTYVPQS